MQRRALVKTVQFQAFLRNFDPLLLTTGLVAARGECSASLCSKYSKRSKCAKKGIGHFHWMGSVFFDTFVLFAHFDFLHLSLDSLVAAPPRCEHFEQRRRSQVIAGREHSGGSSFKYLRIAAVQTHIQFRHSGRRRGMRGPSRPPGRAGHPWISAGRRCAGSACVPPLGPAQQRRAKLFGVTTER